MGPRLSNKADYRFFRPCTFAQLLRELHVKSPEAASRSRVRRPLEVYLATVGSKAHVGCAADAVARVRDRSNLMAAAATGRRRGRAPRAPAQALPWTLHMVVALPSDRRVSARKFVRRWQGKMPRSLGQRVLQGIGLAEQCGLQWRINPETFKKFQVADDIKHLGYH